MWVSVLLPVKRKPVGKPKSEIEEYIDSGLLEEYCLGVLPSEIASKVESAVLASAVLQEFVANQKDRLQGRASEKSLSKIWQKIVPEVRQEAETRHEAHSLVLSKNTRLENLREELQAIDFPDSSQNISLVPFRQFLEFEQFLIKVRKFVPEETHDHLLESFFIVDGACTCKVGSESRELSEGDFLEIPLHTPHSVVVTSSQPVTAVLQRVRIY